MRRYNALSLLSLILTVLLGVTSGTSQTATAQQPTVDLSASAPSFENAVRAAESDSALVDLAVALQSARADTKISFSEYKKGVHLIRQHHPGFYGNFFGDPFYATYDIEYDKLAWERQLAELDVNPVNSIRNSTWFFCSPSAYDPAFNGVCRGSTFAASNFSRLPAFIGVRQTDARTRVALAARRPASSPRPPTTDRARGGSPSEPDTLIRRPDRNAPSADERTAGSIHVPEEAASQMQRRALELRRIEFRQRIREMVEEEYGGREALTPEQRADLADRLSETASLSDRPSEARDARNNVEQRIPSTERGNMDHRLQEIRDRLEEHADRPRPGSGQTAHRPTSPQSGAAPSPSGGRSGGASDAGSSSTNRNPPSPDRDGSGGGK